MHNQHTPPLRLLQKNSMTKAIGTKAENLTGGPMITEQIK